MLMIKKHFKRLMSVAVLLLTSMSVSANSQVNDDLQAYLDNLAASRPAKVTSQESRQKAKRVRKVSIPIDIPVVDLSLFSSATDRTKPLEVKTDVKFSNGTISSSDSFEGDCLLSVTGRATVVVDASASVNAVKPSGTDCLTAISISGSSSVTQYGDILAPSDECWAVYLDTEADTYKYVSGTIRGKVRRFEHQSDFEGYNGRTWMIGRYTPIRYDFADINEAMASNQVKDGDILFVDRACILDAQTVDKSVKIVGNSSYWISGADFPAINGSNLYIESANVTVVGLRVTGNVYVRDDYATIERCAVYGKIMGDEDYICDYAKINECLVTQGVDDSAGYDWTISAITNGVTMPPYVNYVDDMPYFEPFTIAQEVVAGEELPVVYAINNVPTVNLVEYFWDEDPGWAKAKKLENANSSYVLETGTAGLPISTEGLEAGRHLLVVRARSYSGYWVTQVVGITVKEPLPPIPLFTDVIIPDKAYNDNLRIAFTAKADGGLIDWVEYYWDNDPGEKKGHLITGQGHDNGQGISRTDYKLECADMTGEHTLYLRAFCGSESVVYAAKVKLDYDDTPYEFNGYTGRIWTIGNCSPIRYDFADINAAMASNQVKDGDILQVDRVGYPQASNVQNVSKKVMIVGNLGYSFDNFITADINITSGNVTIKGLWVLGDINIQENSVSIDRTWVMGKIRNNTNHIIRNVTISNSYATIDQSNSYNWTVSGTVNGRPSWVADVPVFTEMHVPSAAVAGESLPVEYIVGNLNSIGRVEYFWDSDPGWGKATALMTSTGYVISTEKENPLNVSTTNLTPGNHTLVIRLQSGVGYWVTSLHTVTIAAPVIVDPTPVFTLLTVPTSSMNDDFKISFTVMADGGLIDRVEYYWDTDPGYGQGKTISGEGQDGGNGISRTDYAINCLTLTGSHTFCIRARCGTSWTEHRFENIILLPHPINADDLAALKLISDHLGLNGYWNFEREGAYESDFPGVTFVDHRVTEIDLSNHAYSGELSTDWMPALSEITYLNLSRNNITGDVAPLVARMPKLRSLDLSHNRISQVSGTLPNTLTTVNLKSQYRIFGNSSSGASEGFVADITSVDASTQTASVGSKVTLTLPSLFYYDAKANDNSLMADVQVVDIHEPTTIYGTYSYNGKGQGWKFTPWQSGTTTLEDKTRVALVSNGEWQRWSACPAMFDVTLGDANIDGSVNILDVQHTLNYILATAQPFNLWAANTYVDHIINVQDIVCTINIFLGLPNTARSINFARSANGDDNTGSETEETNTEAKAQCWLYEQGEGIALHSTVSVAAIDVEIDGVKTDEVSLLLNHRDFQMVGCNTDTGSRYVIFSPTGVVIPASKTTALLSMAHSGQPVAIRCAGADASEIASAIGQPTAIRQVHATADGTTIIETRLAPGIYIVRTTDANGESKTVKILKK